ncbi:endonuclease NucS [soil metagenome]|nr:endonuclease NucS [Trueperaceae bacterium]
MVEDQRITPDAAELVEFLDEHLGGGRCLVQVIAECEVMYVGRAASVADAGDFVVMLKADGSLQVHDYRGVKPVNWQPRADHVRVAIEDEMAVLTVERRSPEEMVRIVFLETALAQALHLREGSGFVLMGSEAEMQRALTSAPELIEPGLRVLDVELPTDVGGIDLFARDREGVLLVVELKRGKATQEAVHQLARYVERVREITGERVRGVLAAPAITKPALAVLARRGLEFAEVTALPDVASATLQPGLFSLA